MRLRYGVILQLKNTMILPWGKSLGNFKLSWTYIESENAIENLEAVAQSFGNRPEKIDNGPDTAPSKRILKEIPEYDKVAAGVDTLELVGIDALKEACPHFSEWVEKLVRIF